jgi:PAS domain S-box-containing protein/putative nucleotidyltransferase with HDIG domain
MNGIEQIKNLQAEIDRLNAEIEGSRERELELERARRAMHLMMEDLNDSSLRIELAKKEWEDTFDAISDPIFIHDEKFRIVRANKAYQAMAGMKFKEFIGVPYYKVFPEMEGPFKYCGMKHLQGDCEEDLFVPSIGKTYRVKSYPLRTAGETHMIHRLKKGHENTVGQGFSLALSNPKGLPYRFVSVFSEQKTSCSVCIMEDITEIKRAYDALRASQEYARNIIDSSLDMIVAVDCERRITEFNRAARETFGYKPEEVLGRHVDIFYAHPDEGRKVHEMTMENGSHVQEVLNRRKNGEVFPSLLSASMLRDPQGNIVGIMGVSRDITEQKLAEEKLREEMEMNTHLLMMARATAKTTDIDRLMEEVVYCAGRIMESDICLSYLWDRGSKAFRPSQAYGLDNGMVPMFMTETLGMKVRFVKEAMKKKEPAIMQLGVGSSALDVESPQPPFNKGGYANNPPLAKGYLGGFSWLPDVNTIAVIPLIGKKGPLGLIVGVYTRPTLTLGPLPEGKFTERDRKTMEGVMHQASTALEEARLYKDSIDKAMELSHKIETIRAMHEIDRVILSALKNQEMLETATGMIARVVPCDRATIGIVDRERKGFTYAAGFGVDFIPKGAFVAFGETPSAEVVKTGRPQYVADLREIEHPLPGERELVREGFRSQIKVPLIVKNEVVGVLSVSAKRPSAYTPEDLSTLENLGGQIGVAMENARLVTDLEELFLGTVKSLSSAIDAKSPWTAGHSERVTRYAIDIGREMGLSGKEVKDLELAGLLHDIGKIGTYESILDKPGGLTEEESAMIRQHPVKGAEILEPIRQLRGVIPTIRSHHEHYDGKGYPDGLRGEDIPLSARILTVADTVDAMGAERPYRKGRGMADIIAELKRCSGTQFDPKVVEAFLKTINH